MRVSRQSLASVAELIGFQRRLPVLRREYRREYLRRTRGLWSPQSLISIANLAGVLAELDGVPTENFERFVKELGDAVIHVLELQRLSSETTASFFQVTDELVFFQGNFALERDLIKHAEVWLAMDEQKKNLDPIYLHSKYPDAVDFIIRRTSERDPTLPACHAVRSFVENLKERSALISKENDVFSLREQEELRALLIRLIELLKLSVGQYDNSNTQILRSIEQLTSNKPLSPRAKTLFRRMLAPLASKENGSSKENFWNRLLGRAYRARRRGRPAGSEQNFIFKQLIFDLLSAAENAGGHLTFSKEAPDAGGLWPVLQKIAPALPPGMVPKTPPLNRLAEIRAEWRKAYGRMVN
jgi:hypothetical protein